MSLNKRDRDKLARMGLAFDKIDSLLFRMGQTGLQRMTQSSAVELQALAQTAHNAGLIKIKREIEVLDAHVTRYLERDPLFRAGAYRTTLNRIWMLNRGARKIYGTGASPEEMVGVVGEARRRYELVSRPLQLQPLGASGWVTDGDFVGITVYYQVIGSAEIFQVSAARPTMYFGNDPRRILHMDVSDNLSYTVHDLAHGSFIFQGAKVSRDGRLSMHQDLVVSAAATLGVRGYDGVRAERWSEVVERLRQTQAQPAPTQTDSLVYVEPAAYGDIHVDEKRSCATGTLTDTTGAQMWIDVKLTEENNYLVDNLERLVKPKLRPDGLFGRAWVADGRLRFFPYTAVYHRAVQLQMRRQHTLNEIHLTLEPLNRVSRE